MSRSDLATHALPVNTVDIFGVRVHALTVAELHQAFSEVIDHNRRSLVLNVNVHCLNLAYDRPWLVDFLNRADLVYCDGEGVVLGAKLLNQQLPGRITLADWLWELAAYSQARGYSLFFLGAREGVAQQAAERLRERFPDLKIAGTHHGYFDKSPHGTENRQIIDLINERKPDILIVGFGMPLQEEWLLENWPKLDAHIVIAGGAIFDFISGELKRAPMWMNDNGLEWLGRLIIEPRRLWQRYLVGNPKFLARVLKERVSGRRSTAI